MDATCRICQKTIPYKDFSLHGKTHLDVTCQICGKTFAHYNILLGHLSVSHSNTVFNRYLEINLFKVEAFCEMCMKPQWSRRRLRDHYIQKHCIQNCPLCQNPVKGLNKMKRHFFYQHIKGFFQCNKCDFLGKTAGSFVKHMKARHFEFADFCWTCAKFFTGQANFKYHIEKEHPMGDLLGDFSMAENNIQRVSQKLNFLSIFPTQSKLCHLYTLSMSIFSNIFGRKSEAKRNPTPPQRQQPPTPPPIQAQPPVMDMFAGLAVKPKEAQRSQPSSGYAPPSMNIGYPPTEQPAFGGRPQQSRDKLSQMEHYAPPPSTYQAPVIPTGNLSKKTSSISSNEQSQVSAKTYSGTYQERPDVFEGLGGDVIKQSIEGQLGDRELSREEGSDSGSRTSKGLPNFQSKAGQGLPNFESKPQGNKGLPNFDSNPRTQTQGLPNFDSNPRTQTQGLPNFDSNPRTQTQGLPNFDSRPKQGLPNFESKQGLSSFSSKPTQNKRVIPGFEDDDEEERIFQERLREIRLQQELQNSEPLPKTSTKLAKDDSPPNKSDADRRREEMEKMIQDRMKKEREDKEKQEREVKKRLEKERKEREIYQDPQKLHELLTSKLNEFSLQIQEAVQKQRDLRQKKEQLTQEIKILQDQINDAREQQDVAVAEEDYELADKLNSDILNIEQYILDKTQEIENTLEEKTRLEHSKSDIYTQQRAFLDDLAQKSGSLQEEESQALQAFQHESEKIINEKQHAIATETDKVNKKEEIINEQVQELNKKQEEVEAKISENTKELQQQKEEYQSEVEALQAEIEELQRQLQIKLELQQTAQQHLNDTNTQIEKYMQDFQTELDELKSERQIIDETLSELESDKENLHSLNQELQSKQSKDKLSIEERQERIDHYSQCFELLNTEQTSLSEIIQQREKQLQEITTLETEIRTKKTQLSDAESYLQECTAEIDESKMLIQKSRARIAELEASIPQLEEEKANAVKAKQFKEAGSITSSIKAAQGELEQIQVSNTRHQGEIDGKQEMIETVESSITELKQEIQGYYTQLEEIWARLLEPSSESEQISEQNMGMFRSQDMEFYNLIIPNSQAWTVLNELGRVSCLQFYDHNPDINVFSRTYAENIRICEEMERRAKNIEQEMDRFHIRNTLPGDINQALMLIDEDMERKKMAPTSYFSRLCEILKEEDERLKLQIKNFEEVNQLITVLNEKRLILEKAMGLVGHEGIQEESIFSNITGIIEMKDVDRFKRMIFRATRGNALMMFDEVQHLQDGKGEERVLKSVFTIIPLGSSKGTLTKTVQRICDSFSARKMEIKGTLNEIQGQLDHVIQEIADNENIAQITNQEIERLLQRQAKVGPAGCSRIQQKRLYLLKDKMIYHTLNMFMERGGLFYGSCWCPTKELERVNQILQRLQAGEMHPSEALPKDQPPPTYFQTNDFTSPFQEIVNTYGIPSYKEVNPAMFTCMTFPFLFGIMFGDIGHGSLLLCFAMYLCFFKDKIIQSNGLLKALVPVRYLLLMMAVCASYCGLIYNDFFGFPFNFFGSKWSKHHGDDQYTRDAAYPFGMDPIWYKTKNELVFFNSFKMKVSVIFGVLQMIAGILLSGANALFFKRPLDIYFEFIPRMIFMCSIFGYMVIMIFVKWSSDWNYNWNDDAPNLITVLMNMFLKGGQLDDQNTIFSSSESQEALQLTLVLIALLSVPFMLLPKPLILRHRHKKREQRHVAVNLDEEYQALRQDEEEEEQFNFGEEFIHQMIETIEFVLGAVSNTASYLRLWALSLAHGQLSRVFFEKCIKITIETDNPVLVMAGYYVYANVTIGVLMCMDSLECFLHALRLHWVEFQNKFYKGGGVKFMPLSFSQGYKEQG